MGVRRAVFEEQGFIAPVPLLSAAKCAALVRSFVEMPPPAPPVWGKGRWMNDQRLFDLATSPALCALLEELLGPDVVLWGAEILHRLPRQLHPWHVDVESAAPEGGFASVWIGIENTSRDSALRLISHSHRFGEPIQKVAGEAGYRRGEADDATVLGWARARAPEAELVAPEVVDGEAIVFDGRLWHGSFNRQAELRRTALLLQFARADRRVAIPDAGPPEWPFAMADRPQAPVVAVVGNADPAVNRVVRLKERPECSTYALPLPLAGDDRTGWKGYRVFSRTTPAHDRLAVHASVLSPGRCPHPPHRHDEEEILVVLDGEGELVMQDPDNPAELIFLKAGRGAAMYYPAGFAHTIRNAGDQPVTYLMFKWAKRGPGGANRLAPALVNALTVRRPESRRPYAARRLFRAPTRHLGLLHCHVTDLAPGGVVAPHVDAHDSVVIVLSGRIEVLGRSLGENGIAYAEAGQLHGFANRGDRDARYLVFEFHPLADAAATPALPDAAMTG